MAGKIAQVSTRRKRRPSSGDEKTTGEENQAKRRIGSLPTTRVRTGDSGPSSGTIDQRDAKPIVVDGQGNLYSLAFLADGEHVVSAGREGKIRRWRLNDGLEVGTPMDAEGYIWSLAVSQDGRWIVHGKRYGEVTVWDAKTHVKVNEFKARDSWIGVVDVSPDGTRIATGSDDHMSCVWSLSTGQRLAGPWEHDNAVYGVKFSPDNRLVATATWERESVRVYDSREGHLLVDVPIEIGSDFNYSLAWASDGKRLFSLSQDGNIHCLNAFTGTMLAKWSIHGDVDVKCIALASNDAFIAASVGPLVSFWDTATQEQIGPIIKHNCTVWSMAISANNDLVTCGKKTIFHCNLSGIFLPSYFSGDERTLAKTIQELRDQLSESLHAHQEKDYLVQSLRAQGEASNGSIVRIGETIEQLRDQLSNSQRTIKEQNESIASLRFHSQETSLTDTIALLEQTAQTLRMELTSSHRMTDSLAQIAHAHEWVQRCESLYARGCVDSAAESLLEMANTVSEEVRNDKVINGWLAKFTARCLETSERLGDVALKAGRRDEAVTAYSTAVSLSPSIPNTVLMKWADAVLIGGSAQEALCAATKFKLPLFVVYRVICDSLLGDSRLAEATECFLQMRNELPDDTATHGERVRWEGDFENRCVQKLEMFGDNARGSQKHDEAIGFYSNILLLDPTNPNVLLKRSNETIELDPSSQEGYEGKHSALHGMGLYNEAFETFTMMLSMLEQSPDPNTRELRHQYFDATSTIRKVIQQTIGNMPAVLIDTESGRLCDKTQQAAAFEDLPLYNELRSSMTTQLDLPRISAEVKSFYRYVMLSHRWQTHEPTFQQVENISIYELPMSPMFSKLKKFCKLACNLRFKWAWSDTCCVNQLNKAIQQESVVAMFRWYHGSSLTIVHLVGVLSESQETGLLLRSVWNTRGWTYQEYVASKVVRFYTEDWEPYLGLDIFNHKESPMILSEMEQAMNFAMSKLTTLQPGLDGLREKLYLASMRQTTREEDIAYSLFGIFGVALPVIYGEGNLAIGRFLEHILTRSADVTLLAWTGSSGSHHSYLPVDLTVYDQILPPHIPPLEPVITVPTLQSSPSDPSLTTALYNKLYALPPLLLASGRLRLPGIVFPLELLVPEFDPESDSPVYRATTPMLGDVSIKTSADLAGMGGLLLIHPWISPLLDRDFLRGVAQFDLATRAVRLVSRLKQPFGALLLEPSAREQYRRVATDSLIMVQLREDVSLTVLMDGVRTVDVQ